MLEEWPDLASRPRNRPARPPVPPAEAPPEERGKGLWLGRWVMALAIVAFLVVYLVQLQRGSSLLYAVLFAGGAMAVTGAAGIAIRHLLLRAAAEERADAILQQVEELTASEEGEDA